MTLEEDGVDVLDALDPTALTPEVREALQISDSHVLTK